MSNFSLDARGNSLKHLRCPLEGWWDSKLRATRKPKLVNHEIGVIEVSPPANSLKDLRRRDTFDRD